MGERGPRPSVVKNLTTHDRRELDQAIIEGRETKSALYERYKDRVGCVYRKFCIYAARIEASAKHHYIGEMVTGVFGQLPDTDIDARARGVVMAMLNNIAVGVMNDEDVNPRQLCDVVKAFDMLRRGTIAESDASRRQLEWEVVRAAGVAEAAVQIKRELASEVRDDPDLQQRLEQAVDRIQERADKPAKQIVTAQIIDSIGRKRGLSAEVMQAMRDVFGIDLPEREGKPSRAEANRRVREVYGVPDGDGL